MKTGNEERINKMRFHGSGPTWHGARLDEDLSSRAAMAADIQY